MSTDKIIDNGSITIYDGFTGRTQTYNLGGIKLSDNNIIGVEGNSAYFAKVDDAGKIFIECAVTQYKANSQLPSFYTMLLDCGENWEHSVTIAIKLEKEQVVDTLMDTIKEIVASNSSFVLSKSEEQMRKELMNMVEED